MTRWSCFNTQVGEHSRVDGNKVSIIIVRGRKSTLGWRLESAAVGVRGDVASLVIDDGFDESLEVGILWHDAHVHSELVLPTEQAFTRVCVVEHTWFAVSRSHCALRTKCQV